MRHEEEMEAELERGREELFADRYKGIFFSLFTIFC